MAGMLEIKMTKCTLYLTEPELQSLLSRDPDLWRKALGRGKAFTRSRQTQERVVRLEETEPFKAITSAQGIIGIDTNPDGLALTLITSDGNFKKILVVGKR